jgi:hypothetical protein
MANKDLHRSLCRGYLSLITAMCIPIWRHDDVYVIQCPAGDITFPVALIGELNVADFSGTVEKIPLEILAQRLESPLRFPLPDKET